MRAIADAMPAMSTTFVEGADGKPRVIRNEHVNLGIAVDVEKADGTRTLVVPVITHADTLDFSGFLAAYEDLIRKVKTGKLPGQRLPGRHHHASPTRAPSARSSPCPG